jgi:hypothetical protein
MLRRDVRRLVWRARQAGRGGGHDDPAARLPGQLRPRDLHRQERALDHDIHQLVPVRLGVVGDWVHRLRSRIQDQDVEPVVPLHRQVHHLPVALGGGHVGDQAHITVHVHRHHRGAGLAQRLHDGAAQATRRLRHDRHTPAKRAARTTADGRSPARFCGDIAITADNRQSTPIGGSRTLAAAWKGFVVARAFGSWGRGRRRRGFPSPSVCRASASIRARLRGSPPIPRSRPRPWGPAGPGCPGRR